MKRRLKFFVLFFIIVAQQGCLTEYAHQYIIYSQTIAPLNESAVTIQTVLADGPGGEIQSFGYCWSIEAGPTILNDTSMQTGAIILGKFEGALTNLTVNKQYYVRAYIIDQSGTVHYGNELVFLNSFFPTFTTTRMNGVTEAYFEVFTELDFKTDDQLTDYGHVWSKTSSPTLDDEHTGFGALDRKPGLYNYTSQLTNLDKSSTYYVRAYVIDKWGVTYSSPITISVPQYVAPGQWSEIQLPEAGLPFYYCILQDNTNLYFLTGNDGTSGPNTDAPPAEEPVGYYNTCTKMNLGSNQLTQMGDFPGSLRGYPRGFFVNGKAYLGFGSISADYQVYANYFDMWEYTPQTNTWAASTPLPSEGERVLYCTSHNGYGYACVRNGDYLELWRYNTTNHEWTMLVSDAYLEPGGLGGDMIGNGNFIYFSAGTGIYRYDIQNNTWQPKIDSPAYLFFNYHNETYAVGGNFTVFKMSDGSPRASIPAGRDDLRVNAYGIQETLVAINLNGETVIGVYAPKDYLDWTPDLSLWFKYSEK